MLHHAPYMQWAKARQSPRFDLATSNVLGCTIDDLEGWRDAISFSGRNDDGYGPLVEGIASRYGVAPAQVATATGTSEANFLVCAALLDAGDVVLVERPVYDPLLAAARMFGADINRFGRIFESGYTLDPDHVRAAMRPRTKLIVLTNPHNPTGAIVDDDTLLAIGRIAEAAGARVVVDEVYLDAADVTRRPAATLGEVFITTSSLTKSYGLASLRCGWTLSSAAIAERLRRARDVVDGSGSIVAERLAALAFAQLDRLEQRARGILEANARTFRTFIEGRTDLECLMPSGGTVAFPRIRGMSSADIFAHRLLSERETAIVPGRFFEAPAHFRIGFGGPPEPFRGGLEMMGAALDAKAY
jgi:aspartate/methionine/tyrosine aminotransferase